jgi:hypothetical protein
MFTSLNRVLRIARVVFAAILLAGVAASVLPLETIAAGPACTLSCCAGRASHAAGSCMDGSCHAVLKRASRQTHHAKDEGGEQLCGLSFSARRLLALAKTSLRPAPTESGPAQFASNTIGKPCLPECGSCATASANSKSDRQILSAASVRQTSPPAHAAQSARAALSRTLSAICRQCAPRAPPDALF